MSAAFLPHATPDELRVQRGRDLLLRIRECILETEAQQQLYPSREGERIVRVDIASWVADNIRAYWSSVAKFDGVLPTVRGTIPLVEQASMGGEDMRLVIERGPR